MWPPIYLIKASKWASNHKKGAFFMTKEQAMALLTSKGVYLTSKGKRALRAIINEKALQEAK